MARAATTPSPRRLEPGTIAGMVAANVALLVGVLLIQIALTNHSGRSSLSDLPHLFRMRGVGLHAIPYLDRPFEYPVVAGMLFYGAVVVAPSPVGVLVATGFAVVLASATVTVLLARMAGARAWRWAVGLPLGLYAFQNWDVFAILALVVGLAAFERGRDGCAGACFGIGALVKLFPVVVVPPLVAYRVAQGDRRGARRLGMATTAVVLAGNLPFVIANAPGWWSQAAFQGRRAATWGSVAMYTFKFLGVPTRGPSAAPVATAVAMIAVGAGLIVVTRTTWRGRMDPRSAAWAAVIVFVLANKVYSPAYDLWLVPFFVLLPVARRWWLAFCAVDATVFGLVYGHFHGLVGRPTLSLVLPIAVAARVIVIISSWRQSSMLGNVALSAHSEPPPVAARFLRDNDGRWLTRSSP